MYCRSGFGFGFGSIEDFSPGSRRQETNLALRGIKILEPGLDGIFVITGSPNAYKNSFPLR